MLCLLAKVEQSQLAFQAGMPQQEQASGSQAQAGSITAVVQKGLQIQIPMAGVRHAYTLSQQAR